MNVFHSCFFYLLNIWNEKKISLTAASAQLYYWKNKCRCQNCEAAIHITCLSDAACPVADDSAVQFRRAGSIMLPLLGDRGSMGSTLSLAHATIDNKDQVRQLQQEWMREQVSNVPQPIHLYICACGNKIMSICEFDSLYLK